MTNQFITTTQLREQSSKVVSRLNAGESLILIYRSKIIGSINPVTSKSTTIDDLGEFKKALLALKPKKIIPYSKRKKIYKERLKKRYG